MTRTPDARFAGLPGFPFQPRSMAVGAKDPVLGLPAMQLLRTWIRNRPEPLIIENGGHFLQEWGQEVTPWFLSRT